MWRPQFDVTLALVRIVVTITSLIVIFDYIYLSTHGMLDSMYLLPQPWAFICICLANPSAILLGLLWTNYSLYKPTVPRKTHVQRQRERIEELEGDLHDVNEALERTKAVAKQFLDRAITLQERIQNQKIEVPVP